MFFQPIIGVGGYGGWRILEATGDRQREAFEGSPLLAREAQYFRENIENATTAEVLVNDRRLLDVALKAYGLGDEINKRAYIQKILEEGTQSSDAFANRIADQRFRDFASAFGYGDVSQGTNVLLESFREDVIARYKTLEFETAIGNVDEDMRLALNFKRQIGDIATSSTAERSGWFQVMGQLPLRTLVATALGIPDSVAALDLDRQNEIFQEKAQSLFGESTVKALEDPENIETMIRRFFLFRQAENGPSALTPGLGALTLLQSSPLTGGGAANFLLSQA